MQSISIRYRRKNSIKMNTKVNKFITFECKRCYIRSIMIKRHDVVKFALHSKRRKIGRL